MRPYLNIFETQKRLLAEAKQVGVIYHFTSMSNAWVIVGDEAVLKPKGEGRFEFNGFAFVNDRGRDWVSFTRNQNLRITPGAGGSAHNNEPWHEVRIAFDGDKLSNRHRIEPFHDDDGSLLRTDNQAEEKITGKVNAKGAILGMTFYYDLYMRNQTDFESWASVPPAENRIRYMKQAREEAAWFIREMHKAGIPVSIERGKPATTANRN